MIKKLRLKFILLSMLALFVLLLAVTAGMNILNYNAVVSEADDMLALMAKNKGSFPNFGRDNRPRNMSPEAPFEARYFSVLLDGNDVVQHIDTGRIAAVDAEMAVDYAIQVASEGKSNGFMDGYRFVCSTEPVGTRITFLDCGRQLNAFNRFLYISIGIALSGYLLFFFVILYFSGRIIRPVAESYDKQKRFITDAGHEIKTPLTIINADADVLELDIGENEWLKDIQAQAKRLTGLTNDLVYLSRMEEARESAPIIEFPFSDVVTEAATPFRALAQTQGKSLTCEIQPMLTLKGNDRAIHQLVEILLDNALKYSPEGGVVRLAAGKQGKALLLSVYNTTESPVPKEKLELLFDRFYRIDTSRSSKAGGHGIGLSIAKAIAEAHNGKIHATTEDGHSLRITVTLPV